MLLSYAFIFTVGGWNDFRNFAVRESWVHKHVYEYRFDAVLFHIIDLNKKDKFLWQTPQVHLFRLIFKTNRKLQKNILKISFTALIW